MKDTGEERRNFARQRTHLSAEVRSGVICEKGNAEYLAFGGTFICVSRTFLPNTIIEVKLDLPRQPTPFCGSARVVWVQKNQAMGLEFLDLPMSERLKLEQFLVS